MKIVTVVGARPQFIKAAAIARAISSHNRQGHAPIEEVIVHTGQHYDRSLSGKFFDELDLPEPRYNLGVGSLPHGAQTGRMLEAVEPILIKEKPNIVMVYGDTNSTLAGAIAAKKLNLCTAHVEAGLRSFNMRMPEEINRVLTDRISDLLFCPTGTAVANLNNEGIVSGVEQTGDVMYDASLFYRERARERSRILERHCLEPKSFILATAHRSENTDDASRLSGIIDGLARLAEDCRVVLPLHPRTRKCITHYGLEKKLAGIDVIEPVPYLDMIRLVESARLVCTDSGGVQKEAFFFRVKCITFREETEWVETVESGWNYLAGTEAERIVRVASNGWIGRIQEAPSFYGDGNASDRIVASLVKNVCHQVHG